MAEEKNTEGHLRSRCHRAEVEERGQDEFGAFTYYCTECENPCQTMPVGSVAYAGWKARRF